MIIEFQSNVMKSQVQFNRKIVISAFSSADGHFLTAFCLFCSIMWLHQLWGEGIGCIDVTAKATVHNVTAFYLLLYLYHCMEWGSQE